MRPFEITGLRALHGFQQAHELHKLRQGRWWDGMHPDAVGIYYGCKADHELTEVAADPAFALSGVEGATGSPRWWRELTELRHQRSYTCYRCYTKTR